MLLEKIFLRIVYFFVLEKLSKKNPCISQNFLPNYNGKENLEEIDIIKDLAKEKVIGEL